MKRDVVGVRAKLAVIVPETNTVVEHDYAALALPGVTFHYGRSHFTGPKPPTEGGPAIDSDDAFAAVIKSIHDGSHAAIEQVMTARPDHMVMGMSAETFWGGAAGNEEFEREMSELCGLKVTTGATACRKALELYGAKRIAFVSPYPSAGNKQVSAFFTDHGFEVVDSHGFACADPAAMAQINHGDLRPVMQRFVETGVDAIVQAGTNLSMVRLAAAAELTTGIPVIPINGACVWDAYRQCGISDQPVGLGRLLEEY